MQSRLPIDDSEQSKPILVMILVLANLTLITTTLRPCLTELSILKEELGDSVGVSSVSLGVCHSAVITSKHLCFECQSITMKIIENGVLFTAGLGTEGQLGGWIDEKTDNAIIISRSTSVDRRLEDPSFDDSRFSDIERIEKYCYIYHVREFGPHNKAMQVSCGDNFTLVLNGKIIYKL